MIRSTDSKRNSFATKLTCDHHIKGASFLQDLCKTSVRELQKPHSFAGLELFPRRSCCHIRDFTIYNAVVNDNATRQKYHWLKEESNRIARAARISAHSLAALCTTTTWNHQIWGFEDNASAQMWFYTSLFLLWKRSYQFIFRILGPDCTTSAKEMA